MRESRLTYGNRRLLKVSQHSRLFNRYGRGEHNFPLSKSSFIESEVKPMKSRCAPMSAEDRQAHHLFISHHCRITARWLGRLVGRFVVLGIILHHHETLPIVRNPRFFPLVFVLLVVSVPFAFPIPDFTKTSALTSSPETLAFSSLVFVLLVVYMSFRYPLSSRNSLLFRNLCPFLLVLPLLPIRNHISSRNSECPFHQRETRSIFAPLRNLEWLSCFAKLGSRSRISRNLIRLFFLFALFGFFAF